MSFMPNQTFRIHTRSAAWAFEPGHYRVIFDDPHSGQIVCVCFQFDEGFCPPKKMNRVGRCKSEVTKRKRKKAPRPLVGELLWMDRMALVQMENDGDLVKTEIQREAIYFKPEMKDPDLFENRCQVMAGFLNLQNLQTEILVHKGLGGLVHSAMKKTGVSRSFVYKLWSLLCILGIDETSLRPRRDRCGISDKPIDCGVDGRKKPGRKTTEQRVARSYGVILPDIQPGMSELWRALIRMYGSKLKTKVKGTYKQRYTHLLQTAFTTKFELDNKGVAKPLELVKGSYPNYGQFIRVVKHDTPELLRLLEQTTQGHFNRSMRGLRGRNWEGSSGPGHQWAIDSTIGDVYLRSSIDRSWIIGRPIVYIIVDVWSTAIVGFYVCLNGPSWATAKISLFNSIAAPQLIGDLWGYQPMLTLNPLPTMCYELLCDRGEYLSIAARKTAYKLIPHMSYTPPYRPDLKGLVEVIHRIEKDKQFLFVPGAMDFRRKEFDLRKSRPHESVFTMREYVHFLHLIFSEYNLIADRRYRMDAHMQAAGVFPSPAGLWRWGHMTEIGLQQYLTGEDLIAELLPSRKARVGRSAVRFIGNDYSSQEISDKQWTAYARNFGGWDIDASYYPGSVSQIWTPNVGGNGLLNLHISDQSNTSPELTYCEAADSLAYAQMRRSDVEHEKNQIAVNLRNTAEGIRKKAISLTKEAEGRSKGAKPTPTDARIAELAINDASYPSEAKVVEKLRDEAVEEHENLLFNILNQVDFEGTTHA